MNNIPAIINKKRRVNTERDKIVTIIWRFLPQYRYDFFNRLRTELASKGIRLNLIYGKNRYIPRKDEVDIDWGVAIKNRTFVIGQQEFYWQAIPPSIFGSELIILMQENKILSNYPIMLKALIRNQKFAFWDHGINHQASPYSLGNFFKKFYSTKASWWFAYTEGVAKILINMGFPKARITVLENAIDTEYLIREAEKINGEQLHGIRRKLGVGGAQ